MKCQHCPVRSALACLGERHDPVCKNVAEGQPGRAEQLVALAEAEASPGWLERVRNLASAVVDHVADGGRLADDETREARMETCRACPRFDPSGPTCLVCGCGGVIPGGLEMKLAWASSRCPLDPPKWGSV